MGWDFFKNKMDEEKAKKDAAAAALDATKLEKGVKKDGTKGKGKGSKDATNGGNDGTASTAKNSGTESAESAKKEKGAEGTVTTS